MPWSPKFRELPDARLDPYRDRCATLIKAGETAGHLLVLTDRAATQLGGHLWWRRWQEHEYLDLYVRLPDGTPLDEPFWGEPLWGEGLTAELERWERGESSLLGSLLHIGWMSQEEAVRVAPEVFDAAYCFDNDGNVIWSLPDS